MFKRITATVLLLAFVSQTFAAPFIMLDYYLNTAVYAKNCVNKARPQMRCNGKCQAMKKIREEEKKEQQEAERKAEYKVNVLSSRSFYVTVVPGFSTPAITSYYLINSGKGIKMPRSFFHPPGC